MHTLGPTHQLVVPCMRSAPRVCTLVPFITLRAHAQRGYGSWVCLSVCYSTSHFMGVCSSHKGYDLLNGKWRSEASNGFLWNCSVAKLECEKVNMQIHNGGRLTTVWSILKLSNGSTHRHETWYVCHYIISTMTAYCLKKPQLIFFITASSLLKLANCSTHGGWTLVCMCITSFPWQPQQ